MKFRIGDKAIHASYGLGEIIGIEDKPIQGRTTTCYVFHTSDMSVWIPIDKLQQHSLRTPTPPEEFDTLYAILQSQGENLHEDRVQRKDQLLLRMHDGQLASVCMVVRDLHQYKRRVKLNDQERQILERAEKTLLTEWTYSLGTSVSQAHQALSSLLGE